MELGTCICFKLTVTDWFPIQVESITHTLCKLRSYIDAVQARAYTFLLKCNFFLTAFLLIFFYLRFRNVFLKHPELVLRNVYQVESTKFAIITIIFSAHQSVLK